MSSAIVSAMSPTAAWHSWINHAGNCVSSAVHCQRFFVGTNRASVRPQRN